MTEKKKRYETEWSFSFANLGKSVGDALAEVGIGEDTEIKSASFAEPLENAAQARLILEPSIGQASVTALPTGSDQLIEADVTYVGEVRFEVRTNDAEKTVLLRQNIQTEVLKPLKDALGSFVHRDELQWNMRLTPHLPLDLQINSGMTANDFDLRGLQLTAVRINGGTGKTTLRLPLIVNHYPVHLNSGTGAVDVDIPAGADIDLKVNNGTGKTSLVIGAGAVVTANLSGGVGQTIVTIPAGAAVRLRATTGMGRIRVPDHYISKKEHAFVASIGTWETPNYDSAERKIDLKYDGGLGGVTIQTT